MVHSSKGRQSGELSLTRSKHLGRVCPAPSGLQGLPLQQGRSADRNRGQSPGGDHAEQGSGTGSWRPGGCLAPTRRCWIIARPGVSWVGAGSAMAAGGTEPQNRGLPAGPELRQPLANCDSPPGMWQLKNTQRCLPYGVYPFLQASRSTQLVFSMLIAGMLFQSLAKGRGSSVFCARSTETLQK